MGNRFTRTTLTARELQTVDRCYHKILTIWARRKDMANEEQKPIQILTGILDLMHDLERTVPRLKREARFEQEGKK